MGSIDTFTPEFSSNFSMNTLDPEEFRRQGHLMIDFLADYYHNIENYPVRSQVAPGFLRDILPESAPYYPDPIETILEDVQSKIIPGITHWQSPNFFAYFPSSGSTAGFLGEMLSTGFNIVGFNWISSPAATELENIVMDWLGKMLQLPKSFLFCGGGGGVLQGTTCEAMLCTLVAARDKSLRQHGIENIGRLVVYCSDQTHCALQKAAKIAEINPKNICSIRTSKSSNFHLCPKLLDLAILSDVQNGLIPLYLCVTIGTTSSTAVDPLAPLSQVGKKYKLWVHVDAAYAGSACIYIQMSIYIYISCVIPYKLKSFLLKFLEILLSLMAYKCFCGRWAVERTARTEANDGRRFWGCVDGINGCRFFRWVDAGLKHTIVARL